jgi:hypothetical protein
MTNFTLRIASADVMLLEISQSWVERGACHGSDFDSSGFARHRSQRVVAGGIRNLCAVRRSKLGNNADNHQPAFVGRRRGLTHRRRQIQQPREKVGDVRFDEYLYCQWLAGEVCGGGDLQARQSRS